MTTPLKRKAADIATSAAKKPKANASITSFFSTPAGSAKPAAAGTDAVSSTVSSSAATAVEDSSQKSTASTTTTPTASIFSSQPTATPTAVTASAPKFDKEKWIEKLTPEQKDLLALEIQSLDESWLAHLKDEVVSKDFLELKRFLKKEHEAKKTIYPPASDVYSWYVLESSI